MTEARVLRTVEELERLDIASLPDRPEPARVLMCTPEFFDVVDVKNAFMEGNIGGIDIAEARREWEMLRHAFEESGYAVATIEGREGLEDMVFAANQTLPGMGRDGRPYVVLGRMRFPSRQREVAYYRDWFAARGYRVLELPEPVGCFEGMGDAIWHPGKELLWVGTGPRTDPEAHVALSALLDVPVIALELVHPSFYHLDTAFCALAPDAALVYAAAFSDEGNRLIRHTFARVVEAPAREAEGSMACNALALGGRRVLIQQGAVETVAQLRAAGFEVVELETREFMKSGGSVFCMKQMIY